MSICTPCHHLHSESLLPFFWSHIWGQEQADSFFVCTWVYLSPYTGITTGGGTTCSDARTLSLVSSPWNKRSVTSGANWTWKSGFLGHTKGHQLGLPQEHSLKSPTNCTGVPLVSLPRILVSGPCSSFSVVNRDETKTSIGLHILLSEY